MRSRAEYVRIPVDALAWSQKRDPAIGERVRRAGLSHDQRRGRIRSMSFVAIGVQQVRLDRRNEHSSFDSRQRDAADR